VAVPAATRFMVRASGVLAPLLQAQSVQAFLKKQVQRRPPGPDAHQRAHGSALVWGEASDGQHTVTSRLRTPEAYHLTVATALASVERTLREGSKPGFQTPSRAFGADFILSFPDVQRRDG
jgi:short subunit dehydrogenase-like uncharacterized protein